MLRGLNSMSVGSSRRRLLILLLESDPYEFSALLVFLKSTLLDGGKCLIQYYIRLRAFQSDSLYFLYFSFNKLLQIIICFESPLSMSLIIVIIINSDALKDAINFLSICIL